MSDALAALDLADGVYDMDTEWRGMVMTERELTAMSASSFPVKPPTAWFEDPQLSQLSPLQIDNQGRVSGHIAAWHTSHIGMAGGIKPPHSKSKYAFFRTGTLETDDGNFVDVGQITLAGGHAPLEASVPQAVAHYDDTNSAIMDVAAGEDRHGIWVAGALRPDVTDAQVRSIRASSVSGDWRPINGRLELVAVCAVNCPGFPIPRARVASGAPIALIAAGVEPLIERTLQLRAEQDIEDGIAAGLSTFRERINRLEDVVLAAAAPLDTPEAIALRVRVHGPEEADELVPDDETLEAGMGYACTPEELRKKVHGSAMKADAVPQVTINEGGSEAGGAAVAPDAQIIELRRRVRPAEEDTSWDDGLDIAVPIAAALRVQVHG